jgi:hypothetical protein
MVIALMLLLFDGVFSFALAGDLDQATFSQLVADLNSNSFDVRQAASQKLLSYVDPKSDIRLTVPQLQSVRAYAHGTGAPSLEVQTRAASIIRRWTQLNPATTKAATDFLAGLKITDWEFNPALGFLGGEGNFKLGAVKIAYEGAVGIKFANELNAAYWRTIDQYNDGLTHTVIPRLEAMRKLVQDLSAEDLKHLVFSMGGTQITKDKLIKHLDQQIAAARVLIKKVNDSIGDPPPGPAKPVPIKGSGMISDTKTFAVAINIGSVTPGNVTFLGLPSDFSLAPPPTGFQFIGDIFDLSANNTLGIDGGSIEVSIDYGNPDLLGLPTSEANEYELVRFADGVYQPFSSTINDTSNFVLDGFYNPPSPNSGLDPFGEFAVIAPISEPRSIMLLGGAIMLAFGFALAKGHESATRLCGIAQRRHWKESRTARDGSHREYRRTPRRQLGGTALITWGRRRTCAAGGRFLAGGGGLDDKGLGCGRGPEPAAAPSAGVRLWRACPRRNRLTA